MVERKLLLIGVWGFPGTWYPTLYRPLKPPSDVRRWPKFVEWSLAGEEVKSHSTTLAMARSLMDDWRVKVVIYGLDTLACPGRVREVRGDEVGAKLREELERLMEGFQDEPRKYDEVFNRAKQVLERYARGYSEEVGLSDAYELHVVPGIGTFRMGGGEVTYSFKGSISTTLTALELDLFKRLEQWSPDAVVLDISHGVNYFPTLALEAVERAVAAYSALERRCVGLAVCNSDPVLCPNQSSTVHLVKATALEESPLSLLSTLASRLVEKPFKMLEKVEAPKEAKALEVKYKEALDEVKSLVNAVSKASAYGLILYLATKLYNVDAKRFKSLAEQLTSAVEEALRGRAVKSQGKRVEIGYNYAIDPDVLAMLYSLELITLLVERAPKAERVDVPGNSKAAMFKLDDLSKFAEAVGLRDPAKRMLSYEISDIKRRVEAYRKVLGKGEARLRELYSTIYEVTEGRLVEALNEERLREIRRSSINKTCKVEPRHFYAHAGMERNLLVVDVWGEISVGYVEKCLSEVDKLLKET